MAATAPLLLVDRADMAGPRLTAAPEVRRAPADSPPHRPRDPRRAQTPSEQHRASLPVSGALNVAHRLWNWFSSVDTDRSGHISAHELREWIHVGSAGDGRLTVASLDRAGVDQRRLVSCVSPPLPLPHVLTATQPSTSTPSSCS